MQSRGPVIVVGGGIAGLMCARTLTRAGHDVALFERDSAIGGRVRTTVVDGFQLDHGFQVLFSAYPTLTAALDLPSLELRAFRPAARIADGRTTPALVGDALADLSLLWPTLAAPQLSLLDKARLLLLRYLATSLSFDDCFDARFDNISTRDFLRQRHFSANAINNFFAPFYGGILLDRSLGSSASVLLYTFKMLAEGRTVVPAKGMGAIPAQLASALPPRTVRTGQRVTRLLRDPAGVNGVILDSGEAIGGACVVLACDPPTIATLANTVQVPLSVPEVGLGCTTVYLRSRVPLLEGDQLWLNASHLRRSATPSRSATSPSIMRRPAPASPRRQCSVRRQRSMTPTWFLACAPICLRWQVEPSLPHRNFSLYGVSRIHSMYRVLAAPAAVFRSRPPRAACSLHRRQGIRVRSKGLRAVASPLRRL